MRSVKRKIVYGKFGDEADIRFMQLGIESSLENEKCVKAEIKQLWKQIYRARKRIEKVLKSSLSGFPENRAIYEQRIKQIREKAEIKRKQKLGLK